MEDERERLFNEFHSLALRLRDLGAIVQNEMANGVELIDLMIGQFENGFLDFEIDLKILNEEVVEYLESLKR